MKKVRVNISKILKKEDKFYSEIVDTNIGNDDQKRVWGLVLGYRTEIRVRLGSESWSGSWIDIQVEYRV